MKKKILSVVLVGALCLSGVACSSNDTKRSGKKEKEKDQKIEEEADEDDKDSKGSKKRGSEAEDSAEQDETDLDEFMRSRDYLLETISEEEILKFVNAIYVGEPNVNDTVQGITERVTTYVGHTGNGCSLYSCGGDICIEFGNTSEMELDGNWINGRDNVCKINYNGYEFNDFDLMKDGWESITVIGNSKSYTYTDRLGSGSVEFHIYDEERAREVYKILCDYIDTEFVDSDRFDASNSYYEAYEAVGPDNEDITAVAALQYNDACECWNVTYIGRFLSIGVVEE